MQPSFIFLNGTIYAVIKLSEKDLQAIQEEYECVSKAENKPCIHQPTIHNQHIYTV